jgi:hypothetical protein
MNAGGPAFPNITPDMPINGSPGMSLRDYLAAHASEEDIEWHTEYSVVIDEETNEIGMPDPLVRELARYAYADAMLKAREKDNG